MDLEEILKVACTVAAGFFTWKLWKEYNDERSGQIQANKDGVIVFKWFFSPPARLVHTAALLCKVPNVTFVDIDLSQMDQLRWWFLRVNPGHQVPAVSDNGRFMAESRDLVRHFFDTYVTDPSLDHWYPKDKQKRKVVDDWMDWSKELHLQIEGHVVASRVAAQRGMPWLQNVGILLGVLSVVVKNLVQSELKQHITAAEEILGKRSIRCKEDLNVGDLTTLQEVAMAMEFHPEFTWEDYPNLNALHNLFVKEVPEFAQAHAGLHEFRDKYIELRDHGPPSTILNNINLTGITVFSFIPYVVWNKALYFLALFGPRST